MRAPGRVPTLHAAAGGGGVTMRWIWAAGLGTTAAAVAMAWATWNPARAAATHAKESHANQIPPTARAVLHERMVRHGEDADALLHAAIRLDRPAVKGATARILSEPWLARPTGSATPGQLNAELPPRFYDLQDQLRRHTYAAGTAADAMDDHALAKEVGQLTTTCIECHANYLGAPPNPPAE